MAWVDAACAAVVAHLADGREAPAQAIREALPELTGRIDLAVGKAYGANVSIAPRVMTSSRSSTCWSAGATAATGGSRGRSGR